MTTRRSFLKKAGVISAASLALPSIFPSCVNWRGANDRLMVGHIGLGSRGTDELKMYFLPHDKFRSVAVCDVFQSRRDAAADVVRKAYSEKGYENPDCQTYQDYRELLDRKDIDMVAITTSDHWHLPIAIHAAQAGKHCHVNKPLGLSYEYMMRLKAELEKGKLHFNYGSQQRSYSFMIKAMEYIHKGDLGEIKEVMVWAPGGGADRHIGYFKAMDVPSGLDYDAWLGPAPQMPYTADRVHRDGSFFINDYSIGFLAGWGAHPLDILVWALADQLQENFEVNASGQISWPEGCMYDNINIWDSDLTYMNGLKIRFMSQDLAKPVVMKYLKDYRQNGTLFIGSKGWMSLSRTYAESNIPEIHQATNDFPKQEWGLHGDQGNHALEFAKLIQGERDHYMTVDDAIASDLISHASNAAIRLNESLKWNAQKKEMLGSTEANKLMNRGHRYPYAI